MAMVHVLGLAMVHGAMSPCFGFGHGAWCDEVVGVAWALDMSEMRSGLCHVEALSREISNLRHVGARSS